MILRRISTRNFRNLEEAALELHPQANLFVGANGQGKTNYLEAIYFLATTRSFRTARNAHLSRIGTNSLYVEGVLRKDAVEKTLGIGLQFGPDRKRELRVNQQPVPLQKYLAEAQVFAYSSARLEIVRGGPDERRRFLDRGIASLQPGYLRQLGRYGRVVQQRNALLQKIVARSSPASLLDAWDAELVSAAAPIVQARRDYLNSLLLRFREILSSHRYHVTGLQMRYEPSGVGDSGTIEESLSAELRRLRRRELVSGFTLAGPHRDGVVFEVEGRPASEVLSSGEIKMTVLFLKFAKMSLYRDRHDEAPIFLLDDLDAELDLGIMERLLKYISGTVQIVTTSAKESIFGRLRLGAHRRFSLAAGTVTGSGDFEA